MCVVQTYNILIFSLLTELKDKMNQIMLEGKNKCIF